MAGKRSNNVLPTNTQGPRPSDVPADFPSEFDGEFTGLSGQLLANLATLAGMAVGGGGYFGISITDDGGSIRLAIRRASFTFDKRFYNLHKFEGACAWLAQRMAADSREAS